MRNSKSYKYKNYGPIPQNEYSTNNTEIKKGFATHLEYDPNPDDASYKQRLIRRQALHPAGRRKLGGWSRSWKANGWRAESASQEEEFIDMWGYSNYVRKQVPVIHWYYRAAIREDRRERPGVLPADRFQIESKLLDVNSVIPEDRRRIFSRHWSNKNAGVKMNIIKRTWPYFLVCALVFYTTPLIIGDMGNFLVSLQIAAPIACLLSSLIFGARNGFDWLFSLLIGIFFVPVIYICLNASALIYPIAYAVISLAGNFAGGLVYKRGKQL